MRRSVETMASSTATPPALGLEGVLGLMLRHQHLSISSTAKEVLPVIDDLVGLHATVTLSPYLQLHARVRRFVPEQLNVLLEAGGVAKLACMRRTLFIEPAELAPMLLAATRELRLRDRERFLATSGLTPRRYEELAVRVERALVDQALDASQLRKAVGAQESLSPVLIVMCDEARLVRWPSGGGWQSARVRYRLFEEVLPQIHPDSCEERAAIRALVEHYVRRYGPVSETDIAWWTGLRMTAIRTTLASLPHLVRATVEGLRGVFLVDERDLADPRPRVASREDVSLLPVLDPYLQSYRGRERAVDPQYLPYVVDRGGNTTSVVLVGGRVAGLWDAVKQPAPELRLLFFQRPDPRTRRRVSARAQKLAEFIFSAPTPVVEVDAMRPLAEQGTGGFLSPLKTEAAR